MVDVIDVLGPRQLLWTVKLSGSVEVSEGRCQLIEIPGISEDLAGSPSFASGTVPVLHFDFEGLPWLNTVSLKVSSFLKGFTICSISCCSLFDLLEKTFENII